MDIKLSTISKQKDVEKFLEQLAAVLDKEKFNIDEDLTLIVSKKTVEDEQFSTRYTMLDLDYDVSDIVERLRELTIQEYSETLLDKDDLDPPLLFVFGKDIQRRQVYVKLKIKNETSDHVLVVSFHYAKHEMKFPYA